MSSTMTWVIYWWRRCLLIAAQLLQQPVCLQYLALAVDSLSLTHSSLAAALRRRATSGLGKTPAGAQLSILVVIFLFFHYGFVSSGCNRRAINQHYFHISARRWRPSSPVGRRRTPAVLPPSCWAAPVEARRGSRRGNVIDRAVMFVDRVGPRRLDAPAGMQFPSTRSRRRPVKECWTCVCVCVVADLPSRRPTGASRSYSYLMCRCLLWRHVTGDWPPWQTAFALDILPSARRPTSLIAEWWNSLRRSSTQQFK